MNLDQVVGTVMDENGIDNLLLGNAACSTVAMNLRAMLKAHAPEQYKQYRSIRYPGGEGTDTLESRRESVSFLFDASRDLLVPYYKPMHKPEQDNDLDS